MFFHYCGGDGGGVGGSAEVLWVVIASSHSHPRHVTSFHFFTDVWLQIANSCFNNSAQPIRITFRS